MSRIALSGCMAVVLLGSVWPTLAAPPADQKRRAPAVQAAGKPAPAARPAAIVGPVARVAAARAAPPQKVAVRPQVVAKSAVKPSARPVSKPLVVTAKPSKPETKLAAVPRQTPARFDRSLRSSLLPAGSPQLFLQKGPQKAAQAMPVVASPRPAAAVKSGAVRKIAGAAVGAALIGGGIAALAKPASASSLVPSPGTGAVKPAGRAPLANLNHPHVKPLAKVLPSIVGHKNANRPRLPLFVMAPALLGVSWMGREFFVWNRRSYDNVGWVAPIPSCFVGGTVFYRNPWSGECFSFETAEPGDRFAVGTKVYTWTPAKYASVEDMVDDQERNGASIMSEPFRIANPAAPVSRVSAEAGSRAPNVALTLEGTDCSSCLTAIGPVEVTGGQCSVTISNNCGLPVAFDIEFQRDGQTFCQTKLDAASATEVIVCTQPCTAFLESRVNLKSAMPKLANSAPFKGCRPHWAALEEQAR